MLAAQRCRYHLQAVVRCAEDPSSHTFPIKAISVLRQHRGNLLVLFHTLVPELPPQGQGSAPSARAKDCFEHFAWLQQCVV